MMLNRSTCGILKNHLARRPVYWPSKVFVSLFYFTVEPRYMIQTDVPLTESNFINLKRKSMYKIRYTTTNAV